MNATVKNLKQWWLPSLILFLAVLFLSFLLPNLIYPGGVPRDDTQQVVLRTSTQTATPTLILVMITPARINENPNTQTTFVAPLEQNCTYSKYYWGNYPDAWLAENIQIGRLSYTKSEAIAILKAEPQEINTSLLQEFFAALLNTLKGAEAEAVEKDLIQASDWLGRHSLGLQLTESESQAGSALVQALANFNTGVTGPGRCADEPATPTPLPTDTPTSTATPTRTPVIIATRRPPTATQPSDSGSEGGSNDPTEPPDTTEAPPTEVPTEPPPTDPPPPPPTDPPPTDPPPTPTEAPLPTEAPSPTEEGSAPTDIPAPTEAPTPSPSSLFEDLLGLLGLG